MKKLLLAVVLFVTTIASAQKGSILLSGNVGFASEKIGDLKKEGFDFSPKVGYQFTNNWTAGVEGSIMNYKESNTKRVEAYKIGAFTRYSLPLSELFSFYTDLGAGYQDTTLNDAKGMYANITPAIFINVKRGFGLNFSIGGAYYENLCGKGTPRQENIGFNFGKSFTLGISKNFGL
ncbi:hypothetical protein AR687_00270 [Flavobacteriaceae bacterium CRH]|nr:hypothetical protein AR687_00270 [Flavobacteriaceae bacterium CRH]